MRVWWIATYANLRPSGGVGHRLCRCQAALLVFGQLQAELILAGRDSHAGGELKPAGLRDELIADEWFALPARSSSDVFNCASGRV